MRTQTRVALAALGLATFLNGAAADQSNDENLQSRINKLEQELQRLKQSLDTQEAKDKKAPIILIGAAGLAVQSPDTNFTLLSLLSSFLIGMLACRCTARFSMAH